MRISRIRLSDWLASGDHVAPALRHLRVNVNNEDTVTAIQRITGGKGVQYVLECYGARNALNDAASSRPWETDGDTLLKVAVELVHQAQAQEEADLRKPRRFLPKNWRKRP